MIEVILPSLRPLYGTILEDMYRLRYDICVGRWGWQVPGISPGRDKDDFDKEDTVYIVALDEERKRVLGCCRFNPTTEPYMISALWPEACDLQSPPSDRFTWETSRFVVTDKVASKAEYLEIMWQLGVALAEFCMQAGIKRIVWFTDPPFYQTINSMMPVEPLGSPRHHAQDNRTYIPAMGHISESAVSAARANLRDPRMAVTFALAPLSELAEPYITARRKAA
jgi:N-acyl-L-homoserine lactone synthetase